MSGARRIDTSESLEGRLVELGWRSPLIERVLILVSFPLLSTPAAPNGALAMRSLFPPRTIGYYFIVL